MFDDREQIGDLSQLGHTLVDLDVDALGEDELLDFTTGLDALISDAQTAQAHALARLDDQHTTDVRFGMRTASWLAATTGCARGPVVGRLKVGRALRHHFDVVDDAVRTGSLSFDHAKTLTDTANPRVTDVLAGAQGEIVALAQGATFAQWKRDLTALAEHADADGTEPDPYAGNELRLPKTLDGCTEITGTLDAANGLVVRTAINAKADELFRRFTRDRQTTPDLEIPERKTLRALALVELLRTAQSAEAGSGAAPRAEVTLVVHNHEVCDSEGTPLPRAATDIWGCDPEVWAIVVDHMGIPVDAGHTKRLATIAQRRAITVRDGGCTFPGCDAPIDWCDLHHAEWWDHGGPTDLANLVALCRHHHGVTHRADWAMTLDDDQVPLWTTPTGKTLTGQRHHRRSAHQPPGRGQPDPGAELPDDARSDNGRTGCERSDPGHCNPARPDVGLPDRHHRPRAGDRKARPNLSPGPATAAGPPR